MKEFEKILQNKLQNHEANMPAGAWEQFSQRLEGLAPKPNPWKSYLVGGIAAATIGIGAYLLMPSSEEQKNQQPTVVENTTSNQTNNIVPEENNSNNVIAEEHHNTVTPEAGNETDKKETAINGHVAEIKKDEHKTNVNNVNDNKGTDLNKGNDEKVKVTNPVVINNDNKGTDQHNNGNQQVNNHQVPAQIQLVEPEISGIREICQNAEVSFKAANSRNDHDITWILNGEEVSADADFKVSFSKTGTQILQLVYGTVHEGKHITKESEKRFINVLPAPVADIEVNKVNDFSPEYIFKAPVAEGNDYLWSFGDGKVQTGNELTHVYRKKGEYNIALTVTGSNGCKARTAEKVDIEADYNLLTPNAFSPNNDGHNDVFISEALKAMPDVRFRMIIFDKSGKKIFETTRLDNPWDGRNSNTGSMCAPDAYVWRVQLSRPDGTKEEYMGSVTLLQD